MKNFCRHIICFPYIWLIITILFAASLFSLYGNWDIARLMIFGGVTLVVILLTWHPLNAVYGLMGTSGSISVFFVNLILFCFTFSGIYYWGFFKTAGISYDINQPHIDYEMFADSTNKRFWIADIWERPFWDSTIVRPLETETTYIYDSTGTTIVDTLYRATPERLYYQNIDFVTVLQNTALTFLMQEPTDLMATAVTYNAEYSGIGQTINKQKTEQLHWILLFQVLVGWIFFGVFISLLYNKFRYES
ncbi:MAG: hypothetical protein J5767_14605 [Paludibacteraceae bacterium]|nr:hypothetical protein [Paludibacteraceae bacterium]